MEFAEKQDAKKSEKKSRKSERKGSKNSVSASFLKEWGRTSGPMIAGFAFCQCWLTLCFFAPQLFPNNQSTNVYEISLLVMAVAMVPGVLSSKKMEKSLHRRRILYPTAIAASLGTFIIPFTTEGGPLSVGLMLLAAFLTGFPSGWLFVAWYRAFCRANDRVGYILSVVTNSVVLYLLTTLLLPPLVSPWLMVAIACALPLASVYLLVTCSYEGPSIEYDVPASPKTPQFKALLRLCLGLFVISFVDEFMRNQYLGGTDLAFYTTTINLLFLVVKVVFSVLIVAAMAEHRRSIPLMYKASFLLTMAAVLFMPYINPIWGYGITNIGAFFFKLIIMLVAFNLCQSYRISPVLVFSLTRITWSLDLFAGYFIFGAYGHFASIVPDLLGITSVIMGIIIVITYLFAFNSEDNGSYPGTKENAVSEQDLFEAKCARLTRIGKLTKRESEVFSLIVRGRSTPRIQEELSLSANTVNTHTSHIYQKLGVHSRQELLDLVEQTAPEDEMQQDK